MNKFLIVDIGVEVFVQTTYVVYEVLSFEMVFKWNADGELIDG